MDEQRLALEVAKAQAEIGQIQVKLATENQALAVDKQMDYDLQQALQADHHAIVQVLQDVQAQLQIVSARLEVEQHVRNAPKRIEVNRQSDGTLIGTVTSNDVPKRIEVNRQSDGTLVGTLTSNEV